MNNRPDKEMRAIWRQRANEALNGQSYIEYSVKEFLFVLGFLDAAEEELQAIKNRAWPCGHLFTEENTSQIATGPNDISDWDTVCKICHTARETKWRASE